jgi:hypothetical protein
MPVRECSAHQEGRENVRRKGGKRCERCARSEREGIREGGAVELFFV